MSWGPWTSGHSQEFRVGIVWRVTGGDNITVDYWVDDQYGSTADNQTLNKDYNYGGSEHVGFYNGGGKQKIATATFDAYPGWSGTVGAHITGIYNGASPSHHVTARVPARKPNKPAAPTYSSISSSDATVRWNAPYNGGDAINLYQLDFDDGISPERPTTRSRSYDRNGLKPNTRYGVQVRARNSKGWSPWSNTSHFRTDAGKPDQPRPPKFSQIDHDSVHIYWDAPSSNGAGIDKYQMDFDQGLTPERPEVTWGRFYNLKNLEPNTRYGVQVRAHNRKGWSRYSNTAYFRTDATVPGRPGPPSFSSVSHDSFVVSWSAPSKDGGLRLDGSRLQIATDENFSNIVWQDKRRTDDRSWRVSGLTPDTRYYARVLSYNAVGEGPWSQWRWYGTKPWVPSVPLNVSVSMVTPVGAVVSWDAPSRDNGEPVDHYRVRVYSDSSLSNRVVGRQETSTTVSLSALAPGSTYYVTVEAHNSVGYGPASAPVRFRTMHGAWIGTGTGWQPIVVWVGNGSSWDQAQVHVGTGSDWRP